MLNRITSARLPDGLLPAEQTTDQVLLSFLRWRASGDQARREQITVYRDYYEGEHETMLTDRIRAFLDVTEDADFRLNFTPIPVEVLAERLNVAAFDVKPEMGGEAPDGDTEALAGQDGLLNEWWVKNGMGLQQGHVHEAGSRDGDAYVIVEWDAERERPRFSFEQAYDGRDGVEVVYDEERPERVKWAVKVWTLATGEDAGQRRANVYLPGEVRKYIFRSGDREPSWKRFETEGEPWPAPWRDDDGQPLGVPVFHFRANGGGHDYGKSDIHDIVPIQRALNKSVVDLLGGADVEAFQLIWGTGVRKDDEFTVAPRQLIGSSNDKARFGHIPGGDLSKLTGMVDHFIIKMAQRTRTPLAYFQITGQVASAETQKADDTGLVARAERRAAEYGPVWSSVMHMAVRLANTYGDMSLNEELLIETIWDSFERVDKIETERKRSEIAVNWVNAGATLEGAATMAGVTEEELELLLNSEQVDGIRQ